MKSKVIIIYFYYNAFINICPEFLDMHASFLLSVENYI